MAAARRKNGTGKVRAQSARTVTIVEVYGGVAKGRWWSVSCNKTYIGVIGGEGETPQTAVAYARRRWPKLRGRMQLEEIPQVDSSA